VPGKLEIDVQVAPLYNSGVIPAVGSGEPATHKAAV